MRICTSNLHLSLIATKKKLLYNVIISVTTPIQNNTVHSNALTVLHCEAAFLFDPRPFFFATGLLSSSSGFSCSPAALQNNDNKQYNKTNNLRTPLLSENYSIFISKN